MLIAAAKSKKQFDILNACCSETTEAIYLKFYKKC